MPAAAEVSGSIPLARNDAAAYSRNWSSPQPLFATPMIGTSSTPRSTSPTSAGKVSSFARSPVAPKMTSASMSAVAIEILLISRGARGSVQPLEDVVADPERVRDRGQRGVHGTDAGEEAGVDDVQVVEIVGLAVH